MHSSFRHKVLWVLFLSFFLALLWPNNALLKIDASTFTGFFDSPILFLWDCFDALMLADPLLIVIVIEITLLALCRKVWIWWLLHIPFLIWLPLELGYLHRYLAPSSAHIIAILSETNADEALGYLGEYGLLLVPLYLAWIVFVFWITYGFYRANLTWKHRSSIWISLIFVPVLAIYFYGFRDFDEVEKKFSGVDGSLVAYRFSYGLDNFVETYPFGIPLRLYDYFHAMEVLKQHADELKAVHLNLERDQRLAEMDETYVVVIGESSRADHWALMGYSKDTTPELLKAKNLLAFSDAVSAAAATRTAVPVLLSKTKVNDLAFAQFRPSWITAFKEQGFKVYWFSTQMPVGTHDTTIGIYAGLGDETRYLNAGTYKDITEYDEVLLRPLNAVLNNHQKKRLIILHTLGSHFPYQRRYPENFSRFTPDPAKHSLPNLFDVHQKDQIVNAYDNSVLYTDYFLKKVIDAVGATRGVTALWYSSDHGQALFDAGCNSAGHGFFSKYNFHIPVLFWYSDAYRSVFPDKLAGLSDNVNRPVYMGDFYETLLDSFGFKLSNEPVGKSFAEIKYQGSERLVTVDGGKLVDYDKEFAHAACKGNI